MRLKNVKNNIMTLNDLLKDKGIFTDIFKVKFEDEFNTIFGDITPDYLDVILSVGYGKRKVFSSITPDNYEAYIKGVISAYLPNWVKVANLLNADYDPLNADLLEDKTITTTETTESNEDNNLTAVKPFNDPNFTDHDRQTQEKERTRDETKTVTNTKKGIGGNSDIIAVIEKEKALRRDNQIELIIFTLVNKLTLNIY